MADELHRSEDTTRVAAIVRKRIHTSKKTNRLAVEPDVSQHSEPDRATLSQTAQEIGPYRGHAPPQLAESVVPPPRRPRATSIRMTPL